MKTKSVPFSWIERFGTRLDAGPYLGGGIEAKVALEKVAFRKDHLKSLTKGFHGGIFNGPQFSRTYVDSPEFGVPFLGSSSMLRADLSDLPLLRKKDATSPKLSHLRLEAGTTLISCSGTIGRMVYVRPDMEGMWSSQHIMKVVPDPEKIPSGYLYAFLASKFGVPMITSGTYGAIIQHIEPEHIADLPVPRLGKDFEISIHQQIASSANEYDNAMRLRKQVIGVATSLMNWHGFSHNSVTSEVNSSFVQRRMDGFYHSLKVKTARNFLASQANSQTLGKLVESVFEPNRSSRLKVDDERFGVPFLSSSVVFDLDPIGEYLISRKNTPHIESLLISPQDLLIPRSGQIGGVIGKAVLPIPTYYGHAASEHLVRIRCRSFQDACYLWAILGCEPGYWTSVGTAFGSSIPSLDCSLISNLRIPWMKEDSRNTLVNLVEKAVVSQQEAIHFERKAIKLVEKTIEEAVKWHE